MTEPILQDCNILIVEDEYLLADDLCAQLAERGATVIGPAATLAQGMALLETSDRVHAAVLDVNLRGEPVFPLADALAARNLPFIFTTGYDASVVPERFGHVERCEKPLRMREMFQVLARLARA